MRLFLASQPFIRNVSLHKDKASRSVHTFQVKTSHQTLSMAMRPKKSFAISSLLILLALSGCANQIGNMLAKEPHRSIYDNVHVDNTSRLTQLVPPPDPSLIGVIAQASMRGRRKAMFDQYSEPVSDMLESIDTASMLKSDLEAGAVRRFGSSPKVSTSSDAVTYENSAAIRMKVSMNSSFSTGKVTLYYLFDVGTPNAASGFITTNFSHPSPVVGGNPNCGQESLDECNKQTEPAEKVNVDYWLKNNGKALKSTIRKALNRIVRDLDRRLAQ